MPLTQGGPRDPPSAAGMLNPITYAERIVGDFLRYQLTAYPFADDRLHAQMRALLSLETTRATPLLRGPYISLSQAFRTGAKVSGLVKEGLLHPYLATIAHPAVYGHQETAFRAIAAGKTTVVSTGTGSGKTECFLYPILSACLRLRDEEAPPGITAVIVYPMNALAEDQLGRLRRLLCGTGVSFGMYVGKTPERAADADARGMRLPPSASRADFEATEERLRKEKRHEPVYPPEERASREEMRTPGKQPRILLTNVKQLELLLTRQRDIELFDGARLDFLVFDEAHTFSGAAGAETACLVRRLRAFCGKGPQETVCVATSATIADPEHGREAGRAFAARFFGVDAEDVALVGEEAEDDDWAEAEKRTATGALPGNPAVQLQNVLEAVAAVEREPPPKEAVQMLRSVYQAMTGRALESRRWQESLYEGLAANEVVYQTAQALRVPRPLAALVKDLESRLGRPVPEEEVIAWLALGAASRKGGRPLLRPVVHAFVRGVAGAVVSFPEAHEGPKLWLSREDAATAGEGHACFDVTTCTTCGQHFFVHAAADFVLTGRAPGGGQAVEDRVFWKSLDERLGGSRLLFVERSLADEEEDEPRHTAGVWLCRYCGALHPRARPRCDGCGRPDSPEGAVLAPVLAIAQKEEQPGKLTLCIACGATGADRLGSYREPARPVRALTVSDVHVLAQSMLHHAERRRLLVFTDNRQDAAFQAGWMQDHGRRFRLRSLMFEEIEKGPITVGDLTGSIDDRLAADEDLSRALMPEVWREEPEAKQGRRHAQKRRLFLRVQVLRELVTGMRERMGLEPWGRLIVEYAGLSADHAFFRRWGERARIEPATLQEGVATLLDRARRNGTLLDREHKLFTRIWQEGDPLVDAGYVPLMRGVPKGLALRRGAGDEARWVIQWVGERGTGAQQAARRWGLSPDEVAPFFEELWRLLTDELGLLVRVTLEGARGNALPGAQGAHQIDGDKVRLRSHKGLFRCGTCRRTNLRLTPGMACPAFRCKGMLAAEPEDTDDYDLRVLDERFAMVRPREHSAQVPQNDREVLERAFKGQGEHVNTLVCTPTLELGVDIGALDAVLMRNVPPLPANYWQRAGRAGRRHRMAVNLTYARAAGHDRAYFTEPLKMLQGVVQPPRLNLKNEPMVRKHVHATVLTALYRLARDAALPAFERDELVSALAVSFPSHVKAYLFDDAEEVRRAAFETRALTTVISKHEATLTREVERVFSQGWPARDRAVVAPEALRRIVALMPEELTEVIQRLWRRLQGALREMRALEDERRKKGTLDAYDDARRARCDRLIKRYKGKLRRGKNEAEGFDDASTYAVLAAEGFLPGYGLDTGTVVAYYQAAGYVPGSRDWELRRPTSLALREFVPGNLLYANGHRFVPRKFEFEQKGSGSEPGAAAAVAVRFYVDTAHGAVVEAEEDGVGAVGLGSTVLDAMPIGDVTLPHQSHITDDEEHRFQLPVTIYGLMRKRRGGGRAFHWGDTAVRHVVGQSLRLVNVGATSVIRARSELGYPVCRVCGQCRSPLASKKDRDRFEQDHRQRCHQEGMTTGFYADVVADSIVLALPGDVTGAFSVAESLRRGAATVLDMEVGDLQLLAVGTPGQEARTVLLYDPMPGGSGLLDQMIERWEEVTAGALALARGCPSQCATACIDCLLDYRNSFYSAHLDRHRAVATLQERPAALSFSHDMPAVSPEAPSYDIPTTHPEAVLLRMLEKAGFPQAIPQRAIDLGKPLGVTRPDFFFEDPSGRSDGVCIYLDGMSERLHGGAATARRDREIREQLRNQAYEVFEVPHGDVFDEGAMRQLFFRLGRILVGKERADALRKDPSWHGEGLRAHASERPPPVSQDGWEMVANLVDEPWKALVVALSRSGLPPPDDADWDLPVRGRVGEGKAVLVWLSRAPFVALVPETSGPLEEGAHVRATPESDAAAVATALRALLGGEDT